MTVLLLFRWGTGSGYGLRRKMKRITLFTALVLMAGIASAQTALGPRDILDIKVLEDLSINARVTVSDDGDIILPLLGKVQISGLSTLEAETRIKDALEAGYLNRATVSVQIIEYGS